MKQKFLILIVSAVLLSCRQAANKQEALPANKTTSNKAPIANALCFLLIENRDSTSIELVIKNNKVTGIMNWLPYQKDSRKGTLSGTINHDRVQATWSFMQEGMKDTLNLRFKLDSNRLLQKPLIYNAKTGRQQTNTSANYTLAYHTSDKVYN